jgi:hypothetical protein
MNASSFFELKRAQVGEAQSAIAYVKKPVWDPIRKHPRFQKLIAKEPLEPTPVKP